MYAKPSDAENDNTACLGGSEGESKCLAADEMGQKSVRTA
ncbi:hypothetical protein M2387_004884 [Klebsiella sp. BIGb0407]|nr:hypothetical protein [Klebsiella sp. BIGb0407]